MMLTDQHSILGGIMRIGLPWLAFTFGLILLAIGAFFSTNAIRCLQNPLGEIDLAFVCAQTGDAVLFPSHIRALALLKASDSYNVNRPIEALAAIEKAQALSPGIDVNKRTLGALYFAAGNIYAGNDQVGISMVYYDRAIEHDPTNFGALRKRAYNNMQMKRWDAAIADYNLLVETEPAFTIGYYNRGFAQLQLENHGSALRDFTSALKVDPNYAQALEQRAALYLKQDNYAAAREDAAELLTKDNNSVFAHETEARALIGLKKFDDALVSIRKLEDIAGSSTALEYMRVTAFIGKKDCPNSMESIDRVLRSASKFAPGYELRGTLKLYCAKDARGALVDYEQAQALGQKGMEEKIERTRALIPQPVTLSAPLRNMRPLGPR